jgi:drug/metabolite transporter superfamily protein YnfA
VIELVDILPAVAALVLFGVLRAVLRRKAASRREALRATKRQIRRGVTLVGWFVVGAFVVALVVRLATSEQHDAAVAAGCYEGAFVVAALLWELWRVSRARRSRRAQRSAVES